MAKTGPALKASVTLEAPVETTSHPRGACEGQLRPRQSGNLDDTKSGFRAASAKAFKSLHANGNDIHPSGRHYALRAAGFVTAITRAIVAILAMIGALVVLGALFDALW